MKDTKVIRIAVVDDHEMVRIGLRTYIRSRRNRFELVGEAANGNEAVALCADVHPDLLLMDLLMPKKGGLEASWEIHRLWPEIKIVVMTAFNDEVTLEDVLRAGAVGVVTKNIVTKDLDWAIEDAWAGKIVADRYISKSVLEGIQKPPPTPVPVFDLSPREREILEVMCEGVSNQEIATRLSISTSTVASHVSSILSKMNAPSRTAAIVMAIRKKIVR